MIINRDGSPKTATGRTGADRIVEAEQGRRRPTIFDIALRTMELFGKRPSLENCGFRIRQARRGQINGEFAFSEMISLLATFNEAGAIFTQKLQAILDYCQKERLRSMPA